MIILSFNDITAIFKNGGAMALVIKIKKYLSDLRSEGHDNVPSMKELAEILGVHENTLSNMSTNKIDGVSRRISGAIVKEMHRRGFNMKVDDLFELTEE